MTSMGLSTMHYDYPAILWGVLILLLGASLAVITALGTSKFEATTMFPFGTLMIFYGIIMILLGSLMYARVISTMMNESSILVSSLGMLILGVLMLANGALMRYPDVIPFPVGRNYNRDSLRLDFLELHIQHNFVGPGRQT